MDNWIMVGSDPIVHEFGLQTRFAFMRQLRCSLAICIAQDPCPRVMRRCCPTVKSVQICVWVQLNYSHIFCCFANLV